jgi:hypothetical protein
VIPEKHYHVDCGKTRRGGCNDRIRINAVISPQIYPTRREGLSLKLTVPLGLSAQSDPTGGVVLVVLVVLVGLAAESEQVG